MSYVSVYITYFSIPVLGALAFLGFSNSTNKYITAKNTAIFIFTITIVTIPSVSYAGKFLFPISGVTLVILLIIMLIERENK